MLALRPLEARGHPASNLGPQPRSGPHQRPTSEARHHLQRLHDPAMDLDMKRLPSNGSAKALGVFTVDCLQFPFVGNT